MLTGSFDRLVSNVAFAQQVGELVVADDLSSSVPQAIKIKVVCCGSAFSASRKRSFSLRVLLSGGAKDVRKAEGLELIKLRVARSSERPAQAAGKKEQPGYLSARLMAA